MATSIQEESRWPARPCSCPTCPARRSPRAGAKIRITFEDARRGIYEIDATADEAEDLAKKGVKVARRGRKPKGAE
ncbi:MAG: hypothetical protein R3C15_22270 [Thermoleophilia bacterium]